jgi:hypothetical protein
MQVHGDSHHVAVVAGGRVVDSPRGAVVCGVAVDAVVQPDEHLKRARGSMSSYVNAQVREWGSEEWRGADPVDVASAVLPWPACKTRTTNAASFSSAPT